MTFSSKYLEEAVHAFSSLPGIGRKTALRLALHLLYQPEEVTEHYTDTLRQMRAGVKECSQCFNLSDEALCSICQDTRRDQTLICVVEHVRQVMAIEETGNFRGLYHVLGGVISPIDGIGPQDLNIEALVNRVEASTEKPEIILAISPTIEGETTTFFISRQLAEFKVEMSTIARGVSFGNDLEYADELTLSRSITARRPYTMHED